MVKRGKVRDICEIIQDKPKTPVHYTPRIQVSQFSHPSVPLESDAVKFSHPSVPQESDAVKFSHPSVPLESDAVKFSHPSVPLESDAVKFSHPSVPLESDSVELIPKKKETTVEGIANPVFSIETITETPKQTEEQKDKSEDVFDFDAEDIKVYNQQQLQVKSYPSAQLLSPRRRRSYTTGLNVSEKPCSLTVPDVTNSRRPSEPLVLGRDDHLGHLVPLSNTPNLSYSEGKLPPPSPNFLSSHERIPPPSPGLLSTNSAWSELGKLHSRRSSYGDFNESRTNSNSLSNVSSSLSEHLHHLVRAFSSRTEKVKESTIQPPTPSSLSEYDGNSDANSAMSYFEEPPQRQHRIDSFIPSHFRNEQPMSENYENYFVEIGCCKSRLPGCFKRCRFPQVLEPQSKIYMGWLFLVTVCFLYNAWAIPLRGVFPYQTPSNLVYWLCCDYFSDLVYVLDILVFKPRLTYLVSGLAEKDRKLTRKNYMKKSMFVFDVLSLLPLDLFYFLVGVVPWLRASRVFKIQTFWEFYQRCDQAVRSAHVLRILKTMTYMLFLIHVETCGYYAVSVYEGIGSNRWVYNGTGIAYIRCFYLATKTATSIGNNPKPTNTLEYIFMTIYWVSGVFVFALLIGQIRDIVDAAGRIKSIYHKRMDNALRYIKHLNVPQETQDRIRTWFVFHWQQQKIIDEKIVMDHLPKNLRTDLAIHVHFNTLSKVKLFQDCDKSLLFDLVLKLKPILYLPGEYVCKKGEVGKEMYIVSEGQVEVVGGPDNTLVLATLREGSVFGEISLLAMAADGNRRTADVRCKGFTNLFILSKGDFEDAMAEYPEASKHLKKRAKKLLRQNAKLQKESDESLGSSKITESIIRTPHRNTDTPKLLRAVLKVMDPESSVIKQLSSSMHRNSNDTINTQNSMEMSIKKQEDEAESMSLPNADEVEEFYDEMLRSELMDQETYEAAGKMANDSKTRFQRDDTVNTEQSEASTDSGVQMTKATSPPGSANKTSNKDSKESFISTELTDIFEETCSWVIKQALSRQTSSDDVRLKKNSTSKPEEFLGEFFKDPEESSSRHSVHENRKLSETIQREPSDAPDHELQGSHSRSNSRDEGCDADIKDDLNSDDNQTEITRSQTKLQSESDPKQQTETCSDGTVSENKTDSGESKGSNSSVKVNNTVQQPLLLLEDDEVFEDKNDVAGTEVSRNDFINKMGISDSNFVPRGRNRKISSCSITYASSDCDQNGGELLLNSLTNTDHVSINSKQFSSPFQTNFSSDHGNQSNSIPLQNQIVCSVEVHREKSHTPSSLVEWLESNNSQSRKESSTSVVKETGLLESSL